MPSSDSALTPLFAIILAPLSRILSSGDSNLIILLYEKLYKKK